MSLVARSLSLVLALASVGCGGASSAPESSANGNATSGSEEESIALDDFVAAIHQETVGELCGSDGAPLRQCFAVDASQCGQLFQVALEACRDELRPNLPAVVDASNAEATSNALAGCAGEAYGVRLAQQGLRSSAPECQSGE